MLELKDMIKLAKACGVNHGVRVLIKQCMSASAKDRPSAQQIVRSIKRLLHPLDVFDIKINLEAGARQPLVLAEQQ